MMINKCTRLKIPDLMLIKVSIFKDRRGSLVNIYNHSQFSSIGINDRFVQDLISYSTRGVLRGLHYQKQPKAQAKLVTVLRGEIFDVAVDIRKGSPTYGEWAGVTLSSDGTILYIPKGFAHGFCVLSDEAIILYKLSAEYDASLDRGIVWNDPEVGIKWPVDTPIISDKDAKWPALKDADNNFIFGADHE